MIYFLVRFVHFPNDEWCIYGDSGKTAVETIPFEMPWKGAGARSRKHPEHVDCPFLCTNY